MKVRDMEVGRWYEFRVDGVIQVGRFARHELRPHPSNLRDVYMKNGAGERAVLPRAVIREVSDPVNPVKGENA